MDLVSVFLNIHREVTTLKRYLELSACVRYNTDHLRVSSSLSIIGAELYGHRPIRAQGYLAN